MENNKIVVKCDTIEQKQQVLDYAYVHGNVRHKVKEVSNGWSTYISAYDGCHGSLDSYYGHTPIIPFEEFEKNYLKDKVNPNTNFELIIGEYYSTNDGWIFIHVDPVDYQLNNYTISPNGRYWHGTAAIANINNGKQGIKPATLEEKRWLNACIKAGKFVTFEEAMKEDSLVGRYIKALIDYPQMGAVKVGEYGKITRWNYNRGSADFPSQKSYMFDLDHQKDGLPAYELMPEGWTPDMKIEKEWLGEEWIPKIGEYAVMEKAGGWGYRPENNGCVAIIENVKSSANDYKISGKVINPKIVDRYTKFRDIPIKTDKGYICRKATPEEIAFADTKPLAEQIPTKITAMNGKFSIGETVQFITNSSIIPTFEVDSSLIDQKWIKHGNIHLKENKGRVEAIVGEYYIVSYIDTNNQTVQLGFKENVLTKFYPIAEDIHLPSASRSILYPYVAAVDPYDEEVTISLIKPKKEVIIETNVNRVYSVDTQLVKPKTVVLF